MALFFDAALSHASRKLTKGKMHRVSGQLGDLTWLNALLGDAGDNPRDWAAPRPPAIRSVHAATEPQPVRREVGGDGWWHLIPELGVVKDRTLCFHCSLTC